MQIISPSILHPNVNKYRQMGKSFRHENFYLDQEDEVIQFQDNQFDDENYEPSIFLKLFFIYLYFTQGLVLALSSTIPYIYPVLPSYNVMAVFSACTLPYSFKFIIAPIIERYTYFSYGKRKFWIIISQILSSISIFISSFYTQMNQSYQMALLLFASNFFMTFQDISLDSLAKKQLRKSHIISMISGVYQLVGIIFGSLIILKLTSLQFAHQIHLTHPITTFPILLKIVGFLIFVPSVLIHFLFKETILKRQYQTLKQSIGEVFCSYKAFLISKGKYLRTVIFFLVMKQGFNFYNAGYDYELVKAGFSKNSYNTIQNIASIPVSLIACFFTSKIQVFGLKRGIVVAMSLQIIIYILLRIFFPLNYYVIVISTIFSSLFDTWIFMTGTIFIYNFPIHRYSGMFITLLASASNLGTNSAIHTKILAVSNWWLMSWIGIVLQILLLLFFQFFFFDWMQRGITDLDQILDKSHDYSVQHDQIQSQDQKHFQYPKEISERLNE